MTNQYYILPEYHKFKPITSIPQWEDSQKYHWKWENLWDLSLYFLPDNFSDFLQNFSPDLKTLQELHRQLFSQQLGEAAWAIRFLDATGGNSMFVAARSVSIAIQKSLQKNATNPAEILAWSLEALAWIHPFFDGNRRTIWAFTNIWLLSLGFLPINWKAFTPQFYASVHKTGNERLAEYIDFYKNTSTSE